MGGGGRGRGRSGGGRQRGDKEGCRPGGQGRIGQGNGLHEPAGKALLAWMLRAGGILARIEAEIPNFSARRQPAKPAGLQGGLCR